jgi:hypothetical protein
MALTAGAGLLVGVSGGEAKTATPPDVAAIPPDCAIVVSFRLADLWEHSALRPVRDKLKKDVTEIATELQKNLGAAPETIERLTLVVLGVQGGGEAILVHLKKPFDRTRVVALAGEGATEEKYRGLPLFTGPKRAAVALLDDHTYILGQGAGPLRTLLDRPIKGKTGALTPALRLMAEKHAFVLGMNLPDIHEAIKDELPSQVDALRPLLEAQTAAFAADLADEATGRARLTFTDAAAAKKGEQAARDGIDLARAGLAAVKLTLKAKDAAARALIDEVDAALKAAEVQREDTAVVAKVQRKVALDKVVPAIVELVQEQRRSVGRFQNQNNLRQLLLAMHNYHSTFNRLPPAAIYDKRGKPLLSWRVQILPFIEQDALYKEFHLDEPWDSDHNKKLLDKMPRTFMAEGQAKTNRTHYQVFVGKGTCFEGKKGIQFSDITDGLSNTFLIVEAGNAVPWTKPEDLPYDTDKPLPKLGGGAPGGFLAGYADGSVHFLKQDIKPSTLHLLIQRNDGQPLPADY